MTGDAIARVVFVLKLFHNIPMKKADFRLDRNGGAKVLKESSRLMSIQEDAMRGILAGIEAEFFMTFGVVGEFRLKSFVNDRAQTVIEAADAQTGAVLKRNPGWLGTFIDNIRI